MTKAQYAGMYTCFTCLGDSTNAMICTNCGAAIEEFDPNLSTLFPPKFGKYSARFSEFQRDELASALNRAKTDFLQSISLQETDEGFELRSNSIAYEKFIDLLCEKSKSDASRIKQMIQFTPD